MTKRGRARLGDVVELSGLSRSTVDRVLNGRPGVHEETAKKVEMALVELRYRQNSLYNRLAEQRQTIELFLAKKKDPFFHCIDEVSEAVNRLPEAKVYDFAFRGFDPYAPETLAAALANVMSHTRTVIVSGIDTPEVIHEIDKLAERGVRVFTAVSDIPISNRVSYAGQDNFAIGRLAGSMMSKMVTGQKRTIAFAPSHLQFRHVLDRRSGFYQFLGLERPELEIAQIDTSGKDEDTVRAGLKEFFDNVPDLGGVYIPNSAQRPIIDAISSYAPSDLIVVGHELDSISRDAIENKVYTAVLSQDVQVLARTFIDLIEDRPVSMDASSNVRIFFRENLY